MNCHKNERKNCIKGIERRKFIKTSVVGGMSILCFPSMFQYTNVKGELIGGYQINGFANKLLGASAGQLEQWKKGEQLRLIEVKPVHLPKPDMQGCTHYGWPVATMSGSTIIVMHRRIPGHNAIGAGKPDQTMSYGIVLHSKDGGKTWSEPYDLRDCMKPEDRNRGGLVPLSHRHKWDPDNKSIAGYKVGLHAIGTTTSGVVVAINPHGVFRSEDYGYTWTHFSQALRDDTLPGNGLSPGPRIIDDPKHGLLAFGSGNANSKLFPVFSSDDGGANWRVTDYPVSFFQAEPAVIFHDSRYLFITRDQTNRCSHKQISWIPEEEPKIIDTNLEDPRFVDTVDFCFNPVTKRFEVVRSERYRMELWLWSMDPADWDKGQWRRECRLLARAGEFYTTADGFHPAGAVIDEKRGVQHIFIYSGHPNGPAGVFRITRTLDTARLADFMKTK